MPPQPCSACNAAGTIQRFDSSAPDTDHNFAIRSALQFGARYDLGWASVSLNGYASWTNSLARISRPSFADTRANIYPAHISRDNAIAYGGFFVVTIPIN
jgi:hypothetical protein